MSLPVYGVSRLYTFGFPLVRFSSVCIRGASEGCPYTYWLLTNNLQPTSRHQCGKNNLFRSEVRDAKSPFGNAGAFPAMPRHLCGHAHNRTVSHDRGYAERSCPQNYGSCPQITEAKKKAESIFFFHFLLMVRQLSSTREPELRKSVFRILVKFLSKKVGPGDSRYVSLEEQVAIFLYTVVTNLSNGKVAKRFRRSGDTISKYVFIFLRQILVTDISHQIF